ncbi:hypothetical protein N7527_002352 [Penicillium freii]|nr:hypothetical protein N7527_002352 [Penicillium freii]
MGDEVVHPVHFVCDAEAVAHLAATKDVLLGVLAVVVVVAKDILQALVGSFLSFPELLSLGTQVIQGRFY